MEWLKKLLVFLQTNPPPSLGSIGDGLPGPDHVAKIKLGIIIGHEAKAPGAVMVDPFKLSEYAYNNLVAKDMEELIEKDQKPIDLAVILRDGIGIAGAYKQAEKEKCDVVIELHFNAFNGSASGSEVLCTADSGDQELAGLVLRGVCDVFHRAGTSRGVKVLSRADRGGINVHSFPGGRNCLVEPFFGDHFKDAEMGTTRRQAYAAAILDAVLLWGRKKTII